MVAAWRGVAALPMAAVAGCSGHLSTLAPAGPAAQSIARLWWGMLAGSAAILLLVCVLLALSFGRPRAASAKAWLVGGGIVFPAVVLAALLVAALVTGERLIPAASGAQGVAARAGQYRWTFAYPGTAARATAGVLHIPAGRPVTVTITTEDVIHSFWVPRLGGKMDAIPGHANRLTIMADAPGTYHGVCAEYCGTGHSGHVFRVVAHPAAGWAAFAQGARP